MTRAEKSWAAVVAQETSKSKFKVGDWVRYPDGGVYQITAVVVGVFGGAEYRTQSKDGKQGIGFDNELERII